MAFDMKYIVFLLVLAVSDAARILAWYPTPSISHQVVFRPYTLELLKKGHEIVVITTDPLYPNGDGPANLTEIDQHDMSYSIWRKELLNTAITKGDKQDIFTQFEAIFKLNLKIFKNQFLDERVQKIFNGEFGKFDLFIHEAFQVGALVFSHKFNIPAIQLSSIGSITDFLNTVGAPSHPFLYPIVTHQRVFNLTIREKLYQLYLRVRLDSIINQGEVDTNKLLKTLVGEDMPSTNELRDYVQLILLNAHPAWELNRPLPPNMINVGGMHQKPEKPLPEDLKNYLDSSKNGVIYISFGTNVEPAMLPPEKIQTLINVFSKLPYDVLWKWNKDELPGRTENIRISKWLPQSDLLRHPKVKLFITQGGLQSTDEAITAGVPLIGFPMLGDQWYNVEHYVHHGIGLQLEMSTVTEEKFSEAINEIIGNERYRKNIAKLRDIMYDTPETSIDRAVWWTEYVLRHGDARHLRSPAFNISWAQYLELELVAYVLAFLIAVISLVLFVSYKLYKVVTRFSYNVKVKRT